MGLTIKIDMTDYQPWGQARSTMDIIEDNNLTDTLDNMLEELYPDGLTDTELNDILAYDWEWVFDTLGIKQDDDEEEDED